MLKHVIGNARLDQDERPRECKNEFWRSSKAIIWTVGICCLFLFVAVLGSGTRIYAESEGQTDRTEPLLKEHSWALQFQISDNFRLTSFQGATLSAKYQLNARQALRFGVGVNAANRTMKYVPQDDGSCILPRETECFMPPCCPYSYDEITKRKTTDRQMTLDVQYIRYPRPESKRVLVFYGAGPSIGYEGSTERATYVSGETNKYTRTTWKAGISAVIGVEWFVTETISLLGEYGVNLSYQRSKVKDALWVEPAREEKETGLVVESLPVKFGVSLYF